MLPKSKNRAVLWAGRGVGTKAWHVTRRRRRENRRCIMVVENGKSDFNLR